MRDFYSSKTSFLSRLYYQLGEILILEFIFIVIMLFVNLNFVLFQLILTVYFTAVLFSKYNKPITRIAFDFKKSNIIISVAGVLNKKTYTIPFEDLKMTIKMKFIMNYYSKVLEIKSKDKVVVILPVKNSLWDKNEIMGLLSEIEDVNTRYLNKGQANN